MSDPYPNTNIADNTEQELIERVLRIYSTDEQACLRIADHIAQKLAGRRKLIRERRSNGIPPASGQKG